MPQELHEKNGYTLNAANEIEGFLFEGADAERRYHETGKFEYVNTGGYYHSLPGDPLRMFIDTAAEVQRAMGFQNEKDHPEVAPSQFEINYSYGEVVAAADQIQLYKLICRQVATSMGHDGQLPAEAGGGRERQRHAHQRVGQQGRQEPVLGSEGRREAQQVGWEFVDRILTHGNDICLLLNASVNAYRRLDPHFEAPNQIKASAVDRGSMVRIPIGNEKSMRVEVRSVAPDANPYMVLYSMFKTGSGRRDFEDQESAPGEALSAGQHLHAMENFQAVGVDDEAARRGREGTLRRPEAGFGGSLPAVAGHHREGAGSAVPSRGLQPVPLEQVLGH